MRDPGCLASVFVSIQRVISLIQCGKGLLQIKTVAKGFPINDNLALKNCVLSLSCQRHQYVFLLYDSFVQISMFSPYVIPLMGNHVLAWCFLGVTGKVYQKSHRHLRADHGSIAIRKCKENAREEKTYRWLSRSCCSCCLNIAASLCQYCRISKYD